MVACFSGQAPGRREPDDEPPVYFIIVSHAQLRFREIAFDSQSNPWNRSSIALNEIFSFYLSIGAEEEEDFKPALEAPAFG